jgi:bisphosphoglycerate-dependent phosphoglycerate mutase
MVQKIKRVDTKVDAFIIGCLYTNRPEVIKSVVLSRKRRNYKVLIGTNKNGASTKHQNTQLRLWRCRFNLNI